MATSQTLRQACGGYRAMPIQGIMGTQPQNRALPFVDPRLQLDRATIALKGRARLPAHCPGVGRES